MTIFSFLLLLFYIYIIKCATYSDENTNKLKLKHLWKELTCQVGRSSRGKIPEWFEKA